jgi:hypothetical protein
MKLRTVLPAALAALLALPAAAQRESGSFVVRLGNDTVAVEQFVRTPRHLSSHLVSRSPRTVLRRIDADLRADGTVQQLVMHSQVLNDPTLLPQVITVRLGGDSADVRIARGDTVRNLRVATPNGAWPWIGDSYAFAELALRAVRPMRRDSVVLPLVSPGAPATTTGTFRRLGRDSVTLLAGAGESRIATDAAGRVLGVASPNSTRKVTVERISATSAYDVAARFAAAERTGRAMGALSPRDSVVASVGGANVSVAYGRPARRGRQIAGGVVPWNQVWRTGANNATALRTDRDLMFGGTRVPAGSYTLFSLPSRDNWLLIINKQTGQWGTEYHPEQDLARVPAQVRTVTGEPAELFTIRVEPDGQGGALVLSWGDMEVRAPFTVAP